jgi:2,4-dienoyl-CoA reductase-like NADH-dependent reductase (Old Yellow Enzyme family)
MSKLFSPLKIKDVLFKNRIVVSPMCQYSSTDGFANDWHLVHLGSRAVGGAALVIQEASAVSPEGRITPDDLGIYQDDHVEKLQQITQFISQQGSVPGIQLAHAGRKASHMSPWKAGRQIPAQSGGWITVSASDIPFSEKEESPRPLDKQGIQKVIEDFGQATKRAVRAGYKLLEIHAAHGYLIHQFLSPLSNQRSDEYGGSFENRSRLLFEIIGSVKKDWPQGLPLFVRLSCTDWVKNGWGLEESVKLSALLKEKGVDLIDCSSGGTVPKADIPLGPGYQVPFAATIRREAGIRTGAVGLITHADQAETILNQEEADLVILAREFLRDPYFPMHAAIHLREELRWPSQYERAKPS